MHDIKPSINSCSVSAEVPVPSQEEKAKRVMKIHFCSTHSCLGFAVFGLSFDF